MRVRGEAVALFAFRGNDPIDAVFPRASKINNKRVGTIPMSNGAETLVSPSTRGLDRSECVTAPIDDDLPIALVEETFRVDKRVVDTGTVRVRTMVDTVAETVRASVDSERVEVTRVPVDRVIETAPDVREEDGVLIVSVVEERAVVVKHLVLVEELHITRVRRTLDVEAPVTRRVMRAMVERLPANDAQTSIAGDPAADLPDALRSPAAVGVEPRP